MRYFEKNFFKEAGFFYLIKNIFLTFNSRFLSKRKKFKEDILSNKNVYNYLKF